MKNSPGNSLYQNTIFQNGYVDTVPKEEIEAEKDRVRLQKELNEELQQAFGDGDFSDAENTISFSAAGNLANSHSKTSTNDHHRNDHDNSELERVNVLYNVRVRENDQLREEIKRLKNECEFERARVADLLKEAQKYSESENLKQVALHQLELCRGTIRELEKRLIVAEKSTYKSEEANFDCVLKELTFNHKQEVNGLEKTIDDIKNKLNISERNNVKLEQQLEDERRAHAEQKDFSRNEIESHKREIEFLKSKNEKLRLRLAETKQTQSENESLTLQLTRVKEIQSENESLKLQLAKAKENEDVLRTTLMDHVTKAETLHREELNNALRELKLNHQKETEALRENIMSARMEKERLKLQLASVKEEENILRRNLMEHVTKSDVQHREELSELELIYSKKILELEAELQEMESSAKEDMFKKYMEETDRISTTFVDHFDVLNDTVGKLKHELETQMKDAAQTNESLQKLRSEMEKVYQKYVNQRKLAIAVEGQLKDRTQLLLKQKSLFYETMKKIQLFVDQADTQKLSEIVHNSLKNVTKPEVSNNGISTEVRNLLTTH